MSATVKILSANNAYGALASALTPTDTAVFLVGDEGDKFPTPVDGESAFYGTFEDTAGHIEVVLVTKRLGSSLTVVRGQCGTVGRSWDVGDEFSLRVTAELLEDKVCLKDFTTKTTELTKSINDSGTTLGGRLSDEVTARTEAIDAEKTAREEADTKLQEAVDTKYEKTGGELDGQIVSVGTGEIIVRKDEKGEILICSGPGWEITPEGETARGSGAVLQLAGDGFEGRPDDAGSFMLRASKKGTACILKGLPDGSLTWGGKALLNSSDSATVKNLLGEIGVTYIVKTYRAGNTWYRIWSDDWVEQGGYIPVNKAQTTSFPIPFKEVNYTVVATTISTGQASYGYKVPLFISNRTTTSFVTDCDHTNAGAWFACGYKA